MVLMNSNDTGLMVHLVAWKTIEAWFSGVKASRTGQSGKKNH